MTGFQWKLIQLSAGNSTYENPFSGKLVVGERRWPYGELSMTLHC